MARSAADGLPRPSCRRTSENAKPAKFAEFFFHDVG
jgi:hypothetical protein